jgi:hypothetical protein
VIRDDRGFDALVARQRAYEHGQARQQLRPRRSLDGAVCTAGRYTAAAPLNFETANYIPPTTTEYCSDRK